MQVREGYGTTETVTACCLTPVNMYKEGSIGLPFPDTYIKIVKPGTDEEVPYGTEGEILLAGPTVMKEYMNHPEETAQTLRSTTTASPGCIPATWAPWMTRASSISAAGPSG